ncbi:MAG TPA: site-specific DNA-methyltransferase, partial [Planctomycetota bacterium]|nr:site-specific DNA-methyltransferase [Planctomycetota bacterium]
GEHSNIMPLALPLIRNAMVPDGAFYCFTSWAMMAEWLLRYQQYFKLQNILVWDKGRHSGCYSAHSWQFTWEGIFFGIRGPRKIRKYLPDVLRSSINGRRRAMEKPVDVVSMLIEASTDSDETILDPFAGSGTTGRAAKDLGRKCIMVEIEEKYCQIAANRLRQEVLF